MADFSLVPDPKVLVVQVGLFAANYFVVKNLFVKPFVRVKNHRDSATSGNTEKFSEMLKQSQAKADELKTKVDSAIESAQSVRKEARATAEEQGQKIVSAAHADGKSKLEKMKSEIEEAFAQEVNKAKSISVELGNELFKKVTS